MNKVEKNTLFNRIRRAIRAFQGKPVGFLTYGMKIEKCSECSNKLNVVLYECDKEQCGDECPNPLCHMTRDITHAVNFEPIECVNGITFYEEKRRNTETKES